MAGEKKARTILFRIIGVVIAVALLALLAVSLIIAKPQEENLSAAAARPSGQASPAMTVQKQDDLSGLISAFPAPVMGFAGGSGMTFVSASSADAAVEGGFGRVATLNWQTAEGEPVLLRTVWPPSALSLLEDGYHFVTSAAPTLFGSASVRMENNETVRVHAATDQALYVILLPRSLSGQISTLCKALRLYPFESKE